MTSVRGGLAKKFPSTFARSRNRHMCFLEKKYAGKLDLALSEDQQVSCNSVCVKELEYSGLTCGSNRV